MSSLRRSPDTAGPNAFRAAARGDGAAPARPQLLCFYRSTSGSSRRVEGFLAQVLQRRRNHQAFLLHRIDVDQNPGLLERFHVDQIPTLIVVADKRVQARLSAPRGCAEIATALAPWLN
jgi:thioredoxin-like negative regulator of GroEL